MLLADIRKRMQEIVGSGSGSLANEQIDAYLNIAHQDLVPSKVGPECQRYTVDLTIDGTIAVYDLALLAATADTTIADGRQFFAPVAPVIDVEQDTNLELFTDPAAFYEAFGDANGDAATGRPQAVLIENMIATFRPIPGATDSYTIRFHGLLKPNPLSSDGVEPESRALLVASEAAILWAIAYGMSETMQRAQAMSDSLIPIVRRYYTVRSSGNVSHANDWARG